MPGKGPPDRSLSSFVYSIFFSRNCHLISERQISFRNKEWLHCPDSPAKTKSGWSGRLNCKWNEEVTVLF